MLGACCSLQLCMRTNTHTCTCLSGLCLAHTQPIDLQSINAVRWAEVVAKFAKVSACVSGWRDCSLDPISGSCRICMPSCSSIHHDCLLLLPESYNGISHSSVRGWLWVGSAVPTTVRNSVSWLMHICGVSECLCAPTCTYRYVHEYTNKHISIWLKWMQTVTVLCHFRRFMGPGMKLAPFRKNGHSNKTIKKPLCARMSGTVCMCGCHEICWHRIYSYVSIQAYKYVCVCMFVSVISLNRDASSVANMLILPVGVFTYGGACSLNQSESLGIFLRHLLFCFDLENTHINISMYIVLKENENILNLQFWPRTVNS